MRCVIEAVTWHDNYLCFRRAERQSKYDEIRRKYGKYLHVLHHLQNQAYKVLLFVSLISILNSLMLPCCTGIEGGLFERTASIVYCGLDMIFLGSSQILFSFIAWCFLYKINHSSFFSCGRNHQRRRLQEVWERIKNKLHLRTRRLSHLWYSALSIAFSQCLLTASTADDLLLQRLYDAYSN